MVTYRLHSPMDIRPDDGENESPKRIIFLSVEGNVTEQRYFRFVEKYKEKIGINSIVHVEVLSRKKKDNHSNPQDVYNLITECINVKDKHIFADTISKILEQYGDFDETVVMQYLNEGLSEDKAKIIDSAIRMANIDIAYLKFLSNYNGSEGNDVFAMMIDRDQNTNTHRDLEELLTVCNEKNIKCFLSNPCFEFWLLLHVCDVKTKYADAMDDIKENRKVSNNHTFVSAELSRLTGINKYVNEPKFLQKLLPNIDTAIARSEDFAQEQEDVIENVGSNIPELFKIMREVE